MTMGWKIKMPFQCKICRGYFHYKEDSGVCNKCYQMFKWLEIYDKPNDQFGWTPLQVKEEE